MQRIIILGEKYSTNFGEPLLFVCCEKAIKSYCVGGGDITIEYLDFYGRTHFPRQILTYSEYRAEVGFLKSKKIIKDFYHFLTRVLKNIKKRAIRFDEKNTIRVQKGIRCHLGKYYDEAFRDADLVLISGAGTLKYDVRLDFGPYYKIISEYAIKNNVPCIINAVGVESKYNDLDFRCSEFSKTLNSNIFKIISTRDDLAELKKYITNPETEVFKVADTGLLASMVYNISKDVSSDTIGIGIINYERFREFHRGISRNDYISTILGIVSCLNRRNQKWKLFTNGDIEDTICAYEIAEKLKVIPNQFVIIPQSPKNLVEIISSFKAIITSRLHSCIVAYSLDVPFVAISWNNKLSYFAENIGCPERIFDKNLNSDLIVDGLNKALTKGYSSDKRYDLLHSIETAFKRYISFLEA